MKKILLPLIASLGFAASANAAIVYGVDENNFLMSFDSAAPGTTLSSVAITGISNSVAALDFRPLNGALYALSSDRMIYTIDLATGAATSVSGVLTLTGTQFAFDFNPTIDRLRIVSDSNQNYVFNPTNGALTNATNVFYAAGDVNFGEVPGVTGAAYTSSVFGAPAGTTQLYSIDTALDVLTKQANSAGMLTTVGALGFNLGSRTSFDIAGTDAFAFNGSTLYRVNLATGALTSLGRTPEALFGIAIFAPVPEPASWAMMIAGLGVVGLAMRRQRATARLAFS